MGFSFSVSGLHFAHQLGVAKTLQDQGFIRRGTPLAGASGGSLVAVTTALGMDQENVLGITKRLCERIIAKGDTAIGTMGGHLRRELEEVLPANAHEIINNWQGGVRIGIVTLKPLPSAEHISHFHSKSDLIDVILCSCHVPFYCSPFPFTTVRGSLGVDGFFGNMLQLGSPPTNAKNTTIITPFQAGNWMDEILTRRSLDSVLRVGAAAIGSRAAKQSLISAQDRNHLGMISPSLLVEERRGLFVDPASALSTLLPLFAHSTIQELYDGGRDDARQWIHQTEAEARPRTRQ
eukprot:CAMPEP_0202827620 /NCGR_PEP_ID=MMETSP1389-20130828/14396_1 /ASSEMBLY_ACC=CAM_ASM_000865 /TAXON_ID=302021 /ORGANISM="Rhodomonas sp., Strain CCMP768" /LENGTH=291 /DNA_ID=CAMNT_0049501041 /DNA_START=1 /DNA_END=876 /DNA_ORIENTATION=+